MIDFEQIRRSVNIEEVAKWLGLEVHGEKARCPFHQDRTPSLSFKDGRFKCFGCDASGDAVDLVARMKDISTLEAVTQLTEVFHLDECSPTTRKPTEFKEPHLQEYIDNTIETFAVTRQAQDYLELRGFSGESMLQFRFGFDSGKNAIVIPYGSESTYYISRSLVGKQFFKPRTEVAGPEPLFYEESLDQDEPVFSAWPHTSYKSPIRAPAFGSLENLQW